MVAQYLGAGGRGGEGDKEGERGKGEEGWWDREGGKEKEWSPGPPRAEITAVPACHTPEPVKHEEQR